MTHIDLAGIGYPIQAQKNLLVCIVIDAVLPADGDQRFTGGHGVHHKANLRAGIFVFLIHSLHLFDELLLLLQLILAFLQPGDQVLDG